MMRIHAFLVIALSGWFAACEAAPALSNVRFGGGGDETRVVFDLSAPSEYDLFSVADPSRIVIDFDVVEFDLEGVAEWDAAQNDGLGIGQGLVDRFHFAHQKDKGFSRVVLELAADAVIKGHFVQAPNDTYPYHRVVVDLAAADPAAFRAAIASGAPKASAVATAAPPQKRVVVIDAGHGGRDPGAIGQAGTREKAVVLAIAKALKAALERRVRYEVVLTRSDDRFLALGERVNLARRADADIFLSVHANALGDRRTMGSAVYTLNRLGYDRAKRQVLREDPQESLGVDLSYLEGGTQLDVQNTLADLLLRETNNQSSLLARELLREIESANRLLRKPHREENFAVLLAPDVAAVLVEAAFISNAEDERRLNSAKWRGDMAEALARAVDAYFDKAAGL